jgi:hypothetical protein
VSDAIDHGQVLDELAVAFRALDAAREYGYSIEAAANAAGEQLATLDHSGALAIAALLAALVAVDLRPAESSDDLERWTQRYTFLLAFHRDRPA